jgi:hypothetical protein
MHGEIELLPKGAFPGQRVPREAFWPTLYETAQSFVMLDEKRGDHLDKGMMAYTQLRRAERVFVLGYDFHEQNNELISLSEFADRCVVLNWNGNHRVRQRAIDIGVNPNLIIAGNRNAPLEIANAIQDEGLFSL